MTQVLILACCVYGSLLVATVYFTRATTRRVLGALAGGGAVALGSRRGWKPWPMRRAGGTTRPTTRLMGHWPSTRYS